MIASFVGINYHPENLVSNAKMKGITNYGEMFSARDMSIFAQEILSEQYDVSLKSCSIKGLCYQFKKYFDDNNLILIPYPFSYIKGNK